MKKFIPFVFICTMVAISGCSNHLGNALVSIYLWGSAIGAFLLTVFVVARLYNHRKRQIAIGKAWERQMQSMQSEEPVTEYQYYYQNRKPVRKLIKKRERFYSVDFTPAN